MVRRPWRVCERTTAHGVDARGRLRSGCGDPPVSDVAGVDEDGEEDGDPELVPVVVRHDEGETTLRVRPGRTLRDVLLEANESDRLRSESGGDHGDPDLSPYTRLTSRVNCGGRGLCATCGVRLRTGPPPDHWHDRLADRFGYPRLSCQVEVDGAMVVELDQEKLVWGRRESP